MNPRCPADNHRVNTDSLATPARSGGAVSPPAIGLQAPDPDERARVLGANIESLAQRGVDLRSSINAWRARAGRADVSTVGAMLAARAAALCAPLPYAGPAVLNPQPDAGRPIVIEGFAPPWLLMRVHSETPTTETGMRTPLLIVQPDPLDALDALALVDLRAIIDDDRSQWFIGDDAPRRVREWLCARAHASQPAHVLVSPAPPGVVRATPALHAAVRAGIEHQQREHNRLHALVAGMYAARDRAYWARRFEQALAPASTSRLRALVITSRYSTYIRHSASDLASAITRAGHDARVFMEPDDTCRLASVGHLREIAEFQPDLIVLINYTRRHMNASMPANVPFVCWIQDRMAHLFDRAIGLAQTELDYLIGHVTPVMRSMYGYPLERALFRHVPTSAERFHDRPVDPALLAAHDCEVAYISHQSESPEATHARLRPALAARADLQHAADIAFDLLRARFTGDDPEIVPMWQIQKEAFERAGVVENDPRLGETFWSQYLGVVAERVHRHTTIAWAADICERRGWRLHLHGRGWEAHPRFRRFARAGLTHDAEALRAAYRGARACLHASLYTNAHQRVAECALSGGLMLRRGPSPDHELIMRAVKRRVYHELKPFKKRETDDGWYYDIGQLPGAPFAAYRPDSLRSSRPFRPPEWTFSTIRLFPPDRLAIENEPIAVPTESLPDVAFPAARETLFESRAELEWLIERAIEDRGWRGAAIAAHQSAALAGMTIDRFASDLLAHVFSGLRRADESSRRAA